MSVLRVENEMHVTARNPLTNSSNTLDSLKKPTRSKMKFLHVAPPHACLDRKCKLEKLTQINGNFEILYVGKFSPCEMEISYDVEKLKQDYEDATQNMRWASLSFSDMITFWYGCKYLANEEGYQSFKESSIMMETLHVLAKQLYCHTRQLLLVDNDGAVTRGGFHVVQMICEPSDGGGGVMRMVKDELMKSLSRGECTPLVRSFFRDEIENLPQHPQHPISYIEWEGGYKCDVCGGSCIQLRTYGCEKCEWYMCGTCWIAYSKQEVEHLVPVKDN